MHVAEAVRRAHCGESQTEEINMTETMQPLLCGADPRATRQTRVARDQMLGNLLGGLGGVLGSLTGAGSAAPVVWPPSTSTASAAGLSGHGATGRSRNQRGGAVRSDSTASSDAGSASHRMGMQRLAGNRWKVIGLIMLAALTLCALLWAFKARMNRRVSTEQPGTSSARHPFRAVPRRARSRVPLVSRRARPRSPGDVSASES